MDPNKVWHQGEFGPRHPVHRPERPSEQLAAGAVLEQLPSCALVPLRRALTPSLIVFDFPAKLYLYLAVVVISVERGSATGSSGTLP